jgi:hypothetical protein
MRYAKHQSILAVCVFGVISIMGEERLVCMSGEKAGIYAISEIIEVPRAWKKRLDICYWIETEKLLPTSLHAKLRFASKLLDRPLL